MTTNLFGFAIESMDPIAFLRTVRLVFVLLTVVVALMASRQGDDRRVSRLVLAVAMSGHVMAWFATMFPLPNVYGANGSMDRENHLGWANVVALGFSPLRTFQVNHLHFEPVWPLLTAIATGFEVERVAFVFQVAPLLVGLAFLFTVRLAWMRGMAPNADTNTEASFAALGALLLMSTPGDFLGSFRNPWALTFLLKPNHALGLVLVPLAALALAKSGATWRSRLLAGFVLQLLGWAFVIHMALFVCGLIVFVLLSWLTRRADRMKDLVDTSVAIGANLVIVSPYLFMLIAAYPFLQGDDAHRLSPFSERPLEGPLRLGLLLVFSAFAARRVYLEGGRLGRILACQWLGAQIAWQGLPLLGLIGQAREQDEVFYWCRLWIGLFAGVGVFQVVRLVGVRLGASVLRTAGLPIGMAAGLCLTLLLPSLLPTWWNPAVMDQYFVAARKATPDWIAEPTRYIRTQTPRDAVFAGDRNYARWIAAYGARRVLFSDSLNAPTDAPQRYAVENAVLLGGSKDLMAEGQRHFGLQYILMTSAPPSQGPDVSLDTLASRPDLETVYDKQFAERRVMIFKIGTPKAP